MRPEGFSILVVVFCLLSILIVPAGAVTNQQYDPNRTEEMIQSGLLEPVSREQYERVNTDFNESLNMTLGCDDFPRCDPTPVPAPLSFITGISGLCLMVVIQQIMGRV